jgi:hypothetical protein
VGRSDCERQVEAREEEALCVSAIVIDSGALTRLSDQSRESRILLQKLAASDAVPMLVPSPVLVEALTGDGRRDARTNLLLKSCDVVERITDKRARRAAYLRTKARRGSAVDAILVAIAEPDGVVLTTDLDDLEALAAHAVGVRVERV